MSSQQKRNQKRNIKHNQEKKSQELSMPGRIVKYSQFNLIQIYLSTRFKLNPQFDSNKPLI